MDLVLIRHARPACGSDVCYGALEVALAVPMAPSGEHIRDAAHAAAQSWAMPAPSAILASPALRARDTADAVAQAWHRAGHGNVSVRHEPRLREMDFGRWEGRRWDAVSRDELDQWAADLLDARPHGGESARQAMCRVTAWADQLMQGDPQDGGSLWVVGHAGPMRLLAAHWLGLPLAQLLQWRLDWGASCGFRLAAGAGPQARLLWWNRAPA
ncbi:histidine phosphatase family protein [Cupriavidus sp. AU9028]|uniref:histidine phosphatase family protein n=1 Tax=Cupriavidus sp. AU9028 TaxID=2871157 RepID=UPI001C96B4D9|nr:histidine phosphatase family protein [Cupriavidus sp. AU9028]MBY4895414.1 histidine phosphatase family protein [Cupriavidus sp. AU9028]